MKKKIKKGYTPNKWIYIAFFTLPILLMLMTIKSLDNDIWYLLSEGREILKNGIYHIDPLSMHSGLHIIVQNWLSAVILWIIYDFFGEMGLLFFVILCNFFICLLLYKICNLISDKNKLLSLIIMFATDITLSSHYIVSRPQIISFIILLSLIYVLELYIKKQNNKYLIWIPILSLLEVNLHASLWWMMYLFMIPYIIDSFKISFLKTEGYKKTPLFIAIGISLIMGFINPYGFEAIKFIFTSYGDKYMHLFINELLPFSFNTTLCRHMFIIMLLIGLIYAFFRDGKIRVRYICLFSGTLILGFISIKGFSHFILVSIFPLAYFFKDIFPNDFSDLGKKFKNILKVIYIPITCMSIILCMILYVKSSNKIKLQHDAQDAINVIKNNFKTDDVTLYSSFNDGGFVEFNGLKPYIDPRAEAFLKINNKKEDIFKEFYDLQHNNLNYKDFLKKYNFTFLLLHDDDILYNQITNEDNYFIFYDSTEKGYKLLVRNDLYSDEEREEIINSYNEALEQAKNNA